MKLEVEVLRDKRRMIDGFSCFTGRSTELLEQDLKRDFYLNAYEASQYGLIDTIMMLKRTTKVRGKVRRLRRLFPARTRRTPPAPAASSRRRAGNIADGPPCSNEQGFGIQLLLPTAAPPTT